MYIDNSLLLKRLKKPTGTVDVVLDTDTFNEIDDQYALAYLIKSDEKLKLKAIYAAPFLNHKVETPKEGMEKSYNEILNILSLMDRDDLSDIVYKGSDRYLLSETVPVDSPAARNLVDLAIQYTEENPLYVIAIGAITNVASALIMKPEIKDKIVIIWLAGNAFDRYEQDEFNLHQDIAAGSIVFGCGAPLVLLPCAGVVSAFTTSGPELEFWLRGKNKLCDYLLDATIEDVKIMKGGACWTRSLWDVTAVAWLLDDEFMLDRYEHSPIPRNDFHYSHDHRRHFIKYVYHINRDKLYESLFNKLAQ